jgi:signal transduction histidine kinase/CheY-like chemotaxis protein
MSDASRTTILVVDDTEANRFFVSRVLEGSGYRVLQAGTGAGGLEAARRDRPDAIVLDVRLPDTTGFEVVRQLKASPATAGIPVCILSASFTTDDSKVFGLESGADAYLTHPVVPAMLLATIHSLLRVRRAEEAQRFLAHTGAILSTSLDWMTTLRNVARASVPALADWVVVYTAGEGGPLQATAWAHADPSREAELGPLIERAAARLAGEDTPVARALRTGTTEVVSAVNPEGALGPQADEQLRDALRTLATHSLVAAPLMTRGRNVGALVLERGNRRPAFDVGDVALAEELARRAALAIDNARLYVEAETARREAEAARLQAESANRAKSDFLTTMSHELRTPLNAIAGYVDLIEMGLRGPITDQQREDLTRIRRSQQHLAGLIEEVLGFAKIEAGQVKLQLADISLDAVLSDVEALTSPQMRGKRLRYACRSCGPRVRVHADHDRVRQILLNLLSNACKFTSEGGAVRVECEATGGTVVLAVHDTGVGIPGDKLDAVFEPFVQVDGRLTREHQGTGLGLAISRDLARAMGGELRATSEVGSGSVFELTLPRGADAGEPHQPVPDRRAAPLGADPTPAGTNG